MNLEVIYSKIRCGAYMPQPNPPAAKFASQGGAQVRTDAQIKFLYCSLPTWCQKKCFSLFSRFIF